ncbi:MAG: oligosaccharide flippase family protein [Desulfovibrionaceae bacterium]|nr:oligosaccharide flippase family protein [Desulfovibrionaceae bacterium]
MSETLGDTPGPRQGILKRFGYLLGAHWFREALQAAFLIALARSSAAAYGQFMLAAGIGQILLFAAEFGLNQHLATLLARRQGYPSSILLQVSALKAGLLGLAWLAMAGFMAWQGYAPDLRLVVFIIATSMGLEALASSFFVTCQVLGRQDVEGRIRGAGAGLGFGYGLVSLFMGAPVVALALYKAVETAALLGSSAAAVARRVRLRGSLRGLTAFWSTWKGGATYTLMAVTSILYNKVNLFFVQSFAGSEGVARYSATWQIVDGLTCLVTGMLLGRVMFPLLLRLKQSDEPRFLDLARGSARWLLALSLPVMFVLFAESDRIILLVFGPKFTDSVWMQRWLVPTMAAAFMHNLAGYLMICLKRQKTLLAFYVLGLVFNLACCRLLIPGSPLQGAVLAMLLTKFFVALFTVSYAQAKIGLLTARSLVRLAAAAALGAALYFLGRAALFREAAEVLAVLPALWLAWKWRPDSLAPA